MTRLRRTVGHIRRVATLARLDCCPHCGRCLACWAERWRHCHCRR